MTARKRGLEAEALLYAARAYCSSGGRLHRENAHFLPFGAWRRNSATQACGRITLDVEQPGPVRLNLLPEGSCAE